MDADTTRDRGACRTGHRDRRIYLTLERLQAKGFVDSSLGEASEVRGGRAKRYFTVNRSVGKCCSARCRRFSRMSKEWGSWSRNERSAPACQRWPGSSSGCSAADRIWHAWIVLITAFYPAFYHPTVVTQLATGQHSASRQAPPSPCQSADCAGSGLGYGDSLRLRQPISPMDYEAVRVDLARMQGRVNDLKNIGTVALLARR